VHRWIIHFSPKLLESFNRRKRAVTGKWYVDETYIRVRGQWMYLYRAIDSVGDTVEFFFSKSRDLPAAKRFFKRALERHRRPDCDPQIGDVLGRVVEPDAGFEA
jgi:putative transposase